MATMAELLGSTKKQDLFRVARDEKVPYRGKKKHGSQMTEKEKSFLIGELIKVKRWSMSNHCLERLEQKGITATYRDIKSTIYYSTIIEYHVGKHNDEKDVRVLLRAKAVVNDSYNLNVVYSLTRKRIVSVWLNELNDLHNTLDMNTYDKNVKIIGA